MSATAKIDTVPGEVSARSWAPAALACMGVVFGDIGTSPLYTLNVAAKSASPDGQVSPEAVVGIVSLIFWSLIIVISIKYAILIMRADNHGEGGILALTALIGLNRAKDKAVLVSTACSAPREDLRELAPQRRRAVEGGAAPVR